MIDKVVETNKIRNKFRYGKTATGFSTLEILIAFVLIILTITAVMSLVFGSQSVLVDSQTSREALDKAQQMVEDAAAVSLQDFNLVNPIAAAQEDIYTKYLDVVQLDDFTKKITSTVSWQSGGRNQKVQLVSLLTDYLNFSGSTCSSVLSGDWSRPKLATSTLASGDLLPSGFPIGAYPITDIDAYKAKLYVAVSSTASDTDPTFFIFDVSNRSQKALLQAALDNSSTTVAGINALQTVGDYVYAASARTIAKTDPTFGQLQIIDISSSTAPFIKSHLAMTGVTSGGVGSSIFYSKGYIYLGLSSTAGTGAEFYIIDVSDPSSPHQVGRWPAVGSMGAGINAILVKNGFAYLAHPASGVYNEQLTILDVSNASDPQRVGGFFYNGSSGGNGKSLYMVGNTLYLGRTASKISGSVPDTIPEIFTLDISNPAMVSSSGLPTLSLANKMSVNKILARDYLAFLLVNNQLQIVKTVDFSPYANPLVFPGSTGTAMDCEGNYIYIGSTDTLGNSYITTITAQ